MQKIPRLTPDQRSNLVAYLDGELPEPAVKEIDQVLSKSPAVRHDVEMLARTWDLLDQLPRLATEEDFTARTLSVAQKEEGPHPLLPTSLSERLQSRQLRRGGILLIWLAVLAASAFLGYSATTHWISDQSEESVAQPGGGREAGLVSQRRIARLPQTARRKDRNLRCPAQAVAARRGSSVPWRQSSQ